MGLMRFLSETQLSFELNSSMYFSNEALENIRLIAEGCRDKTETAPVNEAVGNRRDKVEAVFKWSEQTRGPEDIRWFAILTSERNMVGAVDKAAQVGDDALLGGLPKTPENVADVNQKNFPELVREVKEIARKSNGSIRFIETAGYFKNGEMVDSLEQSMVVFGNTPGGKELISNLGKKYNQDSIIYAGPETGQKKEMIGFGSEDRKDYVPQMEFGATDEDPFIDPKTAGPYSGATAVPTKLRSQYDPKAGAMKNDDAFRVRLLKDMGDKKAKVIKFK